MFPLNESPDSGCPGVGRADAGQLPADPGWAVSPYLEGCNPVCPPQQRGAAHKHRPIDRWFQKDVSLSSTTTGPWYVSHSRGSPPPEPTKKTKLLVLRHEARGRVDSWNGQLGVPGGGESTVGCQLHQGLLSTMIRLWGKRVFLQCWFPVRPSLASLFTRKRAHSFFVLPISRLYLRIWGL